jgi:pimeloyl-ACP methyl ester carboxylesterase
MLQMVREVKAYTPENLREKAPVVIGAPGFIKPLEGRRVGRLLEQLKERGIIGYEFIYDGVESTQLRNGKTRIVCDFTLEGYVRNLKETIETAFSNPDVDQSRVGVLASSISGMIFAYFITQNPEFPIRSYASISPLVGWKYYGTEQARQYVKQLRESNKINPAPNNSFIPITTDNDKSNNVERVIPIQRLDELERLDAIEVLDRNYRGSIDVMTFVGGKDNVSNPESIKEYHRKLRGSEEKLIVYPECGHAIPIEDTLQSVEFFENTLMQKVAA